MDPDTYIRRETAISIAINVALSALFFLVVFGRTGPVPVWGPGAYVFDFLPQGFMIGLMATLVPGLLARKSLRAGKVNRWPGKSALPQGIAVRALVCATLGAAIGMAGAAAVLDPGVAAIGWLEAFGAKLAFGALIAAIVTPAGLRAELAAPSIMKDRT